MQPHPPEPLVVHPLPIAPEFVGRERELDELCSAWGSGAAGVVALVGLGGAGKTALAARFVAGLLTPGPRSRPEGLFVWSFYQQPDAGQFLQEAHRYFAGASAAATPARGASLLHLLRQALMAGGPHLLVLDGLERVQRQGGSSSDGHGRIEDPLLRGLLTRIAEGAGRATALVTSRFPLTDLEPYRGHGYRPLDVDGLDRDAAIDLLRRRGVRGDDASLGVLIESYGAHALTLDHLGGLIGQFLAGDPRRAPEAPALASSAGDRQGLRLARLLRAYEEHLPPAELALLCRLCLFRGSVGVDQLLRLFLCTPAVHARSAREAVDLIARIPDPARAPGAEHLDLAGAAHAAIEEALCAAPIAGPAEGFPHEVRKAVEEELARHDESAAEEDIEGLIRLYADASPPPRNRSAVVQAIVEGLTLLYPDASLDAPTEGRPLPAADRARVRELGAIYRELREHPLLPKPWKPDDALAQAFAVLGWAPPTHGGPEDLSPYDVLERLRRVEVRLQRLVLRHFALCRVREVCRQLQRKWALAGPLAGLDAGALRRALDALVDRHLVLRESSGSVGVHPAVRDHFARLGDEPGRGGWHDLIREQLVSLARRPGRGLPEDRATLDLVEEAIHHCLEAGRDEEARALYERGLGGVRHLGWKLGEMARGLRVLRGFRECPDRSALGWFLRALGELDEAYLANPMPYFRADLRLLQGRLPEVAAEGDSVRSAIAAFLMGHRTESLPPDTLGPAIPRVQLLLLLGRHREAWNGPRPDRLYGAIGWQGDRVRSLLLLAEVARRQADAAACRRMLEATSPWVLHSGSVEHLCLWHLVRCRDERDGGDFPAARRAADEGVHMARQCGLGLYHILLLSARAEILLRADAEAAERSAREAMALASSAGCRFRWGESEAGHLLGQALAGQWRYGEARAVYAETLALRDRIGDPGAEQTRRLLARLPC